MCCGFRESWRRGCAANVFRSTLYVLYVCFGEFVEEPEIPKVVACSEFSFLLFIGADREDPIQLFLGCESV